MLLISELTFHGHGFDSNRKTKKVSHIYWKRSTSPHIDMTSSNNSAIPVQTIKRHKRLSYRSGGFFFFYYLTCTPPTPSLVLLQVNTFDDISGNQSI